MFLHLLCIFSVIYFMFVMILCVLSLAMTMYVMYLNGLGDDDPIIAMSARVIILRLGVLTVVNVFVYSMFDHS